MTIDEFAVITQTIIDKEGFDQFCPTMCLPVRMSVRTLAGIPTGQDPEAAVLQWMSEIVELDEEVLVAFKICGTQFKVIRRLGLASENRIYTVSSTQAR